MESMASKNLLNSPWSEKVAHSIDDDLLDSGRKSSGGSRRKNADSDSFFNKAAKGENSLLPIGNLNEENTLQIGGRGGLGNRYITADDEFENIRPTSSSDSLFAKNTKLYPQSGSATNFPNTRNSLALSTLPTKTDSPRENVNLIMLIGFAVGIALGTLFNILEVYLKWFQLKIIDLQSQVYGGKTITEFYISEQSTAKKFLYGPFSAVFIVIQSLTYVVLFAIDFLKKPAPKTLVSNLMTHYLREDTK